MVKLKAETCSENCPSIGLKRLGATSTSDKGLYDKRLYNKTYGACSSSDEDSTE